jgi:CBS domain-containing protein
MGAMNVPANVVRLHAVPALPGSLEGFHTVNRVLPEGQQVTAVDPSTPAREALAIMRERGFSQLPVRQGRSVLGIFSYRAFALEAVRSEGRASDLASLPVEEFLDHEKPTFARLNDEFRSLIDVLDREDSVVVSGPEELLAILTPMDVVTYLNMVANSFILLEEIELALRRLISDATAKPDVLRTCVVNALSSLYKEKKLPDRLEDMTFSNYVTLLGDGRNWSTFEPFFGGTRERIRAKLEPIAELRNVVFHFRRELSIEDREQLSTCRDWLRRCVRKIEAQKEDSP